jgi:flagellar assembly protein FliH
MSNLLKKEQLQAHPGDVQPLYGAAPPAAPAAVPAKTVAETPQRHVLLLERIAQELVRERARLLTEVRPELLEIVLSLAREIIGHEVRADPAIIEHTLTQALQNLQFATRIAVRLHPDDLAHLQAHAAVWQQHAPALEFVADEAIERGGCALDSDRGGFDATLETQLRTLREALQAAYNG